MISFTKMNFYLLLVCSCVFLSVTTAEKKTDRNNRLLFAFYSTTTEVVISTSTVVTIPTCVSFPVNADCNGRKRAKQRC